MKIHDGKIDRDMTDEEIQELKTVRKEMSQQIAAMESAAAAKVSARAKLAALGLTDEEIAALVG